MRTQLEEAIRLGSVAVVAMAFLAVAREGLETALLFSSAAQGSTGLWPVLGISLGIATAIAFELSALLPSGAWWTSLLRGMFNLTARPSVLEVIAWAAYAIPVLALFLWPATKRPRRSDAAPPSSAPAASG